MAWPQGIGFASKYAGALLGLPHRLSRTAAKL